MGFTFTPAGQVARRTTTSVNYKWTTPAANHGYVRNGLNQYVSVAGVAFSHDARGNLTGDGARTFAYDLENRLTAVSGSASMTLTYDPLGRLATTVAGAVTTAFLYDGDRLVAEYNASGALTARYVHGPNADEPLVWYAGAGLTDRRYLIADNLGSVFGVDGATLTRYAYGPYGENATWNGSRFRYTGQIALREVQLYHYKARVYDPLLGRFLQTDPVGYADSLNLYGYVGNDPVNNTDPTGMFMQDGVFTRQQDIRIRNGEAAQVAQEGRDLAQTIIDHPGETLQVIGTGASFIPPPPTRIGGSIVSAAGREIARGTPVPVTPRANAREGIYEFPDQANGGVPYVGQSGNIPSRLQTHERTGRLGPGTQRMTEVPGGRTARERAEHGRIQEITGGVPVRQSDAVSNMRDPIGPRRRNDE